MNSRSGVNETNLVNFSTDLSTLNQLEAKDGLLTFPFDHIYACHSDGADRRQTLHLDKEVEISTHCVVTEDKELVVTSTEISRLSDRLSASENQNKRLKDLLIYHLDLIQQQNELITKREKLYQALRQENDTLKTRLLRSDKKLAALDRLNANRPFVNAPLPRVSRVTSTVVRSDPNPPAQLSLNTFSDLILDEQKPPFIFESELGLEKPSFSGEAFELPRPSEPDVGSIFPASDLSVPPLLEGALPDNLAMIESKPSYVKPDMKPETRSEALYTVTSNSGNPVIQRIQRNKRRTSIGSLCRMSKSSTKTETETSKAAKEEKSYDSKYGVSKKSKMINTYGKSRASNLKRTSQYTGSLTDRLRLIDTTPTGEDPYQLGEAEMREQSPIPKLMLQKTNHGRMRICTDPLNEPSTTTSRRIYDPDNEVTTPSRKIRSTLSSTYVPSMDLKKEPAKTMIVEEPDLDIVKTEPEIDWRIYNLSKPDDDSSLCDFSYGDNPTLSSAMLPSLDSMDFQDLFNTDDSSLNLNTLVDFPTAIEKPEADKSKKRGARTTSLIGQNAVGEEMGLPAEPTKRGGESKRGRKRALSTTGAKGAKRDAQKAPNKPKTMRGKVSCRGKKSPVPGMVTNNAYHTLVGDPDLSWYFGLDPEVKLEDVDNSGASKVSTVEVPRWREKLYASSYTLEGTENLDDRVYEKRHQKLEAEERRQLRWHMRRVREQRHVERLRQRQKDPWMLGTCPNQPGIYTIWHQPQRDIRFIEITDTLPVMAFGEAMPDVQKSDFMLPWVKTSKAMKRSKRSKTLH